MTPRTNRAPLDESGSLPRSEGLEFQTHNRFLSAGICLLLAMAVWIVFGQTVGFGFVNYDDDGYVYANDVITHGLTVKGVVQVFTHSHANNWHPLTSMSHMLDCNLYGTKPGGHHLTNV